MQKRKREKYNLKVEDYEYFQFMLISVAVGRFFFLVIIVSKVRFHQWLLDVG